MVNWIEYYIKEYFMSTPIPFVVSGSGDPGDAPEGSIPVNLYGGGGGGGADSFQNGEQWLDTDEDTNWGASRMSSEGLSRLHQELSLSEGITRATYEASSQDHSSKAGFELRTQSNRSRISIQAFSAQEGTYSAGGLTVVGSSDGDQFLQISAMSPLSGAEETALEVGYVFDHDGTGYVTRGRANLTMGSVPDSVFQFSEDTILTPQTLKSAPGYDENATQTLKHVNGELQWVTD